MKRNYWSVSSVQKIVLNCVITAPADVLAPHRAEHQQIQCRPSSHIFLFSSSACIIFLTSFKLSDGALEISWHFWVSIHQTWVTLSLKFSKISVKILCCECQTRNWIWWCRLQQKGDHSVQWRHNAHEGDSTGLLNRLLWRRSKKTSKLCVTGLCVTGPVTSGFPLQRASDVNYVPIWWRHHTLPFQINRAGHHK